MLKTQIMAKGKTITRALKIYRLLLQAHDISVEFILPISEITKQLYEDAYFPATKKILEKRVKRTMSLVMEIARVKEETILPVRFPMKRDPSRGHHINGYKIVNVIEKERLERVEKLFRIDRHNAFVRSHNELLSHAIKLGLIKKGEQEFGKEIDPDEFN